MGGGTAADSRPRINLSIEVVASALVRSGTLPLSRHGQMERQGIGRHLKEPDGIGEHNNKVNDLSHAGA